MTRPEIHETGRSPWRERWVRLPEPPETTAERFWWQVRGRLSGWGWHPPEGATEREWYCLPDLHLMSDRYSTGKDLSALLRREAQAGIIRPLAEVAAACRRFGVSSPPAKVHQVRKPRPRPEPIPEPAPRPIAASVAVPVALPALPAAQIAVAAVAAAEAVRSVIPPIQPGRGLEGLLEGELADLLSVYGDPT